MGEHFRQAGYRTVYGGKWHLYGNQKGVVRGFDLISSETALGARMDAPLASKCGDWLRQSPRNPFLMVASFMNPHDICQWIRDHKGSRSYSDVSLFPPAPANMAADHLEPAYMLHHRTSGYDLMSQGVGIASQWTADDFRLYLHDYYRLVEDVDRNIAALLRALTESGLAQNTVVAFASDHGEGMGSHRWVQKAAFYEESVRVPLIFSAPFLPRRSRRDFASLASLIDIFPPSATSPALPRHLVVWDISRTLSNPAAPPDRSPYGTGIFRRAGRQAACFAPSNKYIAFNGGARPEQLFDLSNDPGVTRNLDQLDTASPLLKQCAPNSLPGPQQGVDFPSLPDPDSYYTAQLHHRR